MQTPATAFELIGDSFLSPPWNSSGVFLFRCISVIDCENVNAQKTKLSYRSSEAHNDICANPSKQS